MSSNVETPLEPRGRGKRGRRGGLQNSPTTPPSLQETGKKVETPTIIDQAKPKPASIFVEESSKQVETSAINNQTNQKPSPTSKRELSILEWRLKYQQKAKENEELNEQIKELRDEVTVLKLMNEVEFAERTIELVPEWMKEAAKKKQEREKVKEGSHRKAQKTPSVSSVLTTTTEKLGQTALIKKLKFQIIDKDLQIVSMEREMRNIIAKFESVQIGLQKAQELMKKREEEEEENIGVDSDNEGYSSEGDELASIAPKSVVGRIAQLPDETLQLLEELENELDSEEKGLSS